MKIFPRTKIFHIYHFQNNALKYIKADQIH